MTETVIAVNDLDMPVAQCPKSWDNCSCWKTLVSTFVWWHGRVAEDLWHQWNRGRSRLALVNVTFCLLQHNNRWHHTCRDVSMRGGATSRTICDNCIGYRTTACLCILGTTVELVRIECQLCMAFHSQTDGQLELMNCSIVQYLCVFVKQQHHDCVKWLQPAQFAANNSVSETMKCTPVAAVQETDPKMTFMYMVKQCQDNNWWDAYMVQHTLKQNDAHYPVAMWSGKTIFEQCLNCSWIPTPNVQVGMKLCITGVVRHSWYWKQDNSAWGLYRGIKVRVIVKAVSKASVALVYRRMSKETRKGNHLTTNIPFFM